MFFTGDSIVRSLAFETSTSEILMVVDDTRPAWGGIDVPGLPLVLDDSTRIVAVTSRKVAGVSVTVNVDDVTAANILHQAGRLVIAKVRIWQSNRVSRCLRCAAAFCQRCFLEFDVYKSRVPSHSGCTARVHFLSVHE
jgi:hypothetical protein